MTPVIWKRQGNLEARSRIRQLDVTPILNRVAPLTDWKTSFDDMDNGKVVKVVLKP